MIQTKKEQLEGFLSRFIQIEMRLRNVEKYAVLPANFMRRQEDLRGTIKRFFQEDPTIFTLEGRKILNRVLYDSRPFGLPEIQSGLGLVWIPILILATLGTTGVLGVGWLQTKNRMAAIQEKELKGYEEGWLTKEQADSIYGPYKEESFLEQVKNTIGYAGIVIGGVIALPWILKTVFKRR